MELLNPSIEQLVLEIIAVNHAWKETKNFSDGDNYLANSLRNLKARLQVRLLRSYAPELVFLRIDTSNDEDNEPLYGLHLAESVNGRNDAAHMPIRVAQENLSTQELQQFVRS